MNVKLLAEIFLAHHGAFQMPSREAFAPWARPVHDVRRVCLLPQRKVVWRPLVALAVKGAGTFQSVIQSAPGKHSVMIFLIVCGNVEIHAAVADVGKAGIKNLLHRFNLLDNVAAGTWLDGRRRDIQLAHRLVVAERVCLHDLHRLQLLQAGLLRNLVLALVRIVLQMAYISYIPDIADLVSQMFQEPEKHVESYSRASVTQMGIAINRRPADIHSHVARVYRGEKFFLPRKSVRQI